MAVAARQDVRIVAFPKVSAVHADNAKRAPAFQHPAAWRLPLLDLATYPAAERYLQLRCVTGEAS
jgi:hypothetical protein